VLLIIIFSVGISEKKKAMDGETAINHMITLDIMNQDIEGINKEGMIIMGIISQNLGGINMASIITIGMDIESLNIETRVIRKQG